MGQQQFCLSCCSSGILWLKAFANDAAEMSGNPREDFNRNVKITVMTGNRELFFLYFASQPDSPSNRSGNYSP
jgi:hypothetical protein